MQNLSPKFQELSPTGFQKAASHAGFEEFARNHSAFHATALLGNYLYTIGGVHGWKFRPVNIVSRMNLQTKKWKIMEPMKECRRNHAAAVCDGAIYVFGGRDEFSAECYDAKKSTMDVCSNINADNSTSIGADTQVGEDEYSWRYLPPMDKARYGAAAVTVNQKIFILGGYIDGRPTSSMIAFDTTTETWNETPLEDLPVGVGDCSAIAYSKYIIVFGGLLDGRAKNSKIVVSDKCFVYDTNANKWLDNSQSDVCALLTNPRYLHSATLLDSGQVIVHGGRGEKGLASNAAESIHVLGLLPATVREREIRNADEKGRLPIHVAVENELDWYDGLEYLVLEYPESLMIQSHHGHIPIMAAKSLAVINYLFKAMLGLNYIHEV